MRRRMRAMGALTGLTLILGGAAACSEEEQARTEQELREAGDKVEEGASKGADEVEEQVNEGAEEPEETPGG